MNHDNKNIPSNVATGELFEKFREISAKDRIPQPQMDLIAEESLVDWLLRQPPGANITEIRIPPKKTGNSDFLTKPELERLKQDAKDADDYYQRELAKRNAIESERVENIAKEKEEESNRAALVLKRYRKNKAKCYVPRRRTDLT